MRELLEVERLARRLIDELNPTYAGECDGIYETTHVCKREMEGEEPCPKCGAAVPFKRDCGNEIRCEDSCGNTVTVEFDDDQALIRELRLALVQLDLARARDADQSTGATVVVAATEAA